MKTKKQVLIEAILSEAECLASEPLTIKQLDTLKYFTEKRLDTHGQHGYMFQAEAYYNKQLVPVYNINMIATYILNNNFIQVSK